PAPANPQNRGEPPPEVRLDRGSPPAALAQSAAGGTVVWQRVDRGLLPITGKGPLVAPLRVPPDEGLDLAGLSPCGRIALLMQPREHEYGSSGQLLRWETWVEFWEIQTGRRRARLRLSGTRAGTSALALSPDDRLLACGRADGSVRLLDADSGAEVARADAH